MLLKKLDHARDVDMFDLAFKKDFIALEAEVDKLDIDKLVNAPTSMNNTKTKGDDLDVGKLKTVPVDWKKLSDVVANEVVKDKTNHHTKDKGKYLRKENS